MLSKRQPQTLRGLSHQEKIKKLQKITKVPLQKLQTNIAESDLEDDDVSVPISLKVDQNQKQSFENVQQRQELSKKKSYGQERINKTIRTMTKQLYCLERQKQLEKQNSERRKVRNISSFSIEEFNEDLEKIGIKHCLNKSMQDFYIVKKPNQLFHDYEKSQQTKATQKLNNITTKANNMNVNLKTKQKTENLFKQSTYRQSQPFLNTNNSTALVPNKINQVLAPPNKLASNQQSSQSNLTKRFSRTKRNDENKNQDLLSKKLKFNRSNHKNQLISNEFNKQNSQNICPLIKTLLIDRLSYQHVSNYSKNQPDLRKKKNTTKNVFGFNQNMIDYESQNFLIKLSQPLSIEPKQKKYKIRYALQRSKRIFENPLFEEMLSANSYQLAVDKERERLMRQVFQEYKESIKILKQQQSQQQNGASRSDKILKQ